MDRSVTWQINLNQGCQIVSAKGKHGFHSNQAGAKTCTHNVPLWIRLVTSALNHETQVVPEEVGANIGGKYKNCSSICPIPCGDYL